MGPGQFLALGWSDGALEVISTETGNAVQLFQQFKSNHEQTVDESNASTKDVVCIGWGLSLINVDGAREKAAGSHAVNEASKTTDDWEADTPFATLSKLLDGLPRRDQSSVPLELPQRLSQLDFLSILPKLPTLPLLPPAAYKTGDHSAAELFASQVSLDAAIHNSNERHLTEIDVLLLCHGDGRVRIVLYDTLSIGTISTPKSWDLETIKYLQHTCHPFSPTQMLLVETSGSQVSLIPLYLKFLQSAGVHLQLIESKTAQLETLVQYIGECLLAMYHHWNHAQELPGKFMSLINETLEEGDNPTLVQCFFHLAVTGNCPPIIKEWLVDQLAERVS